jgi:hypothetical protein
MCLLMRVIVSVLFSWSYLGMVWVWSGYGLGMVWVWSGYGLGMVWVWSEYGLSMVWVWSAPKLPELECLLCAKVSG